MTGDPVAMFDTWFGEARASGQALPEAMTLATATADGAPSARIVLMKGHDAGGFVWFTDRRSQKGDELAENPRAALVFNWTGIRRQVRAEGGVVPVDEAETRAYYRTRPRASQIGAWASHQSAVIASRADLEAEVAEAEARFAGVDPTLPPHWGGYRLAPSRYEFWTHDDARLHHREVFTRAGDTWSRQLLSP